MKLCRFFIPIAASLGLIACNDDISPIGQEIVSGEVVVNIDSTLYDLHGKSVEALQPDARSSTTLLGSISTQDYGNLSCSFVTQLLPATSISIPDSIPLENVTDAKMILRMPRTSITGDSLAPQQLTIYSLSSQLPSDISSNWNVDGKYNPAAIGKANYSLSAIALSDSDYTKLTNITVKIPLDKAIATDAVKRYRTNPDIFQWPSTFAKSYPGLYVKSSFGKGCIANVSNLSVYAYYTYKRTTNVVENNVSVSKVITVTDSTCLFTSAPEVISSSLFSYSPAASLKSLVDGNHVVITTPGGYHASISFPAAKVLEKFWKKQVDLTVINNLKLSIPASQVPNSLGIDVPPSLLMVRTKDAGTFFSDGKIPDKKNSFIADFNSTSGMYEFPSMRSYIVELSKKKPEEITPDDTDFLLIPVLPTYESYTNPYDGSKITEVTSCVPYLSSPRMTLLDTENAVIVFTFSNQTIR